MRSLLDSARQRIPAINDLIIKKDFFDKYNNLNSPYRNENDVVAYAKGRMFDTCMTYGRSHGYSNNELINTPAYIIESLIRHEILSEIDLIASNISTGAEYTTIDFNGVSNSLNNTTDDYYNGAYLINFTQDWVAEVLDYVGYHKRVYIDNSYTIDIKDKYKIFNINGNSLIDTASFDYVGNKTNGKRKNWIIGSSIKDKEKFENILKKICFETFISLAKSGSKYKLFPVLESKTTVDGVLSNPMYTNSMPMIFLNFTSYENIYTEYEIEYGYEYGRNEYQSKFIINDKTATTIAGDNFDNEKLKIKNAINNYKVSKKFVYSCDWIYDESTAVLFTKKIIDLYTKQRLIVTYTGDIKNHIQYEVGDVVKINYPKMIPASLNNSAQFQIQGKSIDMTKRNGSVTFSLLEI